MRGLDTEGGLDGEACNAGGSEESVGGEDHQVGCDSGTGGGIEAGDGQNSLHLRMKKEVWLVNGHEPDFGVARGEISLFLQLSKK
jgi:hypothetical protein